MDDEPATESVGSNIIYIIIGIVLSVVALLVGIWAYDQAHKKPATNSGGDTITITPSPGGKPTTTPNPSGSGLPGDN